MCKYMCVHVHQAKYSYLTMLFSKTWRRKLIAKSRAMNCQTGADGKMVKWFEKYWYIKSDWRISYTATQMGSVPLAYIKSMTGSRIVKVKRYLLKSKQQGVWAAVASQRLKLGLRYVYLVHIQVHGVSIVHRVFLWLVDDTTFCGQICQWQRGVQFVWGLDAVCFTFYFRSEIPGKETLNIKIKHQEFSTRQIKDYFLSHPN